MGDSLVLEVYRRYQPYFKYEYARDGLIPEVGTPDEVLSTLRLDLKDEVVCVSPVSQGIAFLGWRIFPGLVRLQRKAWVRFRRQVRRREEQYKYGMIDEETLAQTVTSMLGHVQHADSLAARRAFFAESLSLG